MIFVIVNKKINNFSPILKSFTRTNKEILFVEYVENLCF